MVNKTFAAKWREIAAGMDTQSKNEGRVGIDSSRLSSFFNVYSMHATDTYTYQPISNLHIQSTITLGNSNILIVRLDSRLFNSPRLQSDDNKCQFPAKLDQQLTRYLRF